MIESTQRVMMSLSDLVKFSEDCSGELGFHTGF